MAYTVRRLPLPTLVSLLVGVVAAAYLLSRFDYGKVIVPVMAIAWIVQAYSESLVLKVNASGVRFRRAFVPWSSIHSVVTEGEQVGVRLRPDAPLPQGVRGVIRDPAGTPQVPPGLRHRIRRLDSDALGRAVAAFGGGVGVEYRPTITGDGSL
jgi:hypothetical protein